MTIWALHGFLGLPSDFRVLIENCEKIRPGLKWQAVDYLHSRELSPQQSLQEWGANFNHYIQKHSAPDETHVLLGYSQGGRLALHALQQQSSLWSKAILISANPGIREGEKALRLLNDKEWAQKFLNDNFVKTVEKWNSQNVFQGSHTEPTRSEKDFNRRQLADCLVMWSVARQNNFSEFLKHTQVPLLHIAGEKDLKYCEIGTSLSQSNARLEFASIEDSGHRVLFDQPLKLAERLISFLR